MQKMLGSVSNNQDKLSHTRAYKSGVKNKQRAHQVGVS